jgi:hypothetical protein
VSAPGWRLPVVRKTGATAVNRIRPFALGSRLLVWLAVPNHKRSLSFRGQLTANDPKRSISLLQTGQLAKSRFCELECSEAAIGDGRGSFRPRLWSQKMTNFRLPVVAKALFRPQ